MPRLPQYDSSWTRLSANMRAANSQCAWCGTSDDLTTDHLVPGKPQFGLQVLCRADNTRLRNGATGPRVGTPTRRAPRPRQQ